MDSGIIIETDIPPPDDRTPLGELLAKLPVSSKANGYKNLMLLDRKRGSVANSLRYWQNKLNHKYKTQQTSKGLRVWRIE